MQLFTNIPFPVLIILNGCLIKPKHSVVTWSTERVSHENKASFSFFFCGNAEQYFTLMEAWLIKLPTAVVYRFEGKRTQISAYIQFQALSWMRKAMHEDFMPFLSGLSEKDLPWGHHHLKNLKDLRMEGEFSRNSYPYGDRILHFLYIVKLHFRLFKLISSSKNF